MLIKLKLSALRQTTWHDYAIRILFGGTITALAGVVAAKYGPAIGGLVLAFPAIFPASATLLEKRETEKKHRLGLHGARRARVIAAIDAYGAALGSFGLLAFAMVIWQFLPAHRPLLILLGATFAWFAVSVFLWIIRKRLWPRPRRHQSRSVAASRTH